MGAAETEARGRILRVPHCSCNLPAVRVGVTVVANCDLEIRVTTEGRKPSELRFNGRYLQISEPCVNKYNCDDGGLKYN